MKPVDDHELETLVKTNWAMQRLRTRMVAYFLTLRAFENALRRRYVAGVADIDQTSGDSTPTGEARFKMPSWEDVAWEMKTNAASLPYLESTGVEDPYDDADGLRRFNGNNLQKFALGERKGKGTPDARFHFNTPDRLYVRLAIAAFLIDLGYVEPADLLPPHEGDIPEPANERLLDLGASPRKIHEDRYFRGDYVAKINETDQVLHQRITIHRAPSKMFYVIRVLQLVFKRRSTEPHTVFQRRVSGGDYSSKTLFSGWGYFSADKPFFVVLESYRSPDILRLLKVVPAALVSPAIEPAPKLPGGEELKTDIIHRLKETISDFLMCDLGRERQQVVFDPILLCVERQEFEELIDTHTQETCGHFAIEYAKHIAELREQAV